MKKRKRFFASVSMMIGMIFMLIMLYGFLCFILFFPDIREQLKDKVIMYAFPIFATGFCPTAAFIITARRWFTLLEIDEKGIKTSLFHFFYRKRISWDELKEIRYYERISPFLFFSKNVSLEGMAYDDIIKRKDVIQASLTLELYRAIRENTDKQIVNLSEEMIKMYGLDK